MNRRGVAFWVVLAVVVLVTGSLVAGGRRVSGNPLDPDSTDPSGTRGLILFLERFDVAIERGALPDDDASHALLLDDRLTLDERDQLVEWVRRGGQLIVTDRFSPLSPSDRRPVGGDGPPASGTCTIPAMEGLELVGDDIQLFAIDGVVPRPLLAPAASQWCFGGDIESYLVVYDEGDGRVIALGGASPLTNEFLDRSDNAVLAARLLIDDSLEPAGPPSGTGSPTMVVLYEPIVVPGSGSIQDLIPSGVAWGTWQLVLAFALYALWRASRFGRPVDEPQPVELPASLLVRATAELHRRARSHRVAAAALRRHLDRRLRRGLDVAPDLPDTELARLAAHGRDLDPATVDRALAGPSPTSGTELAELVADIDRVSTAVLGDARTPDAPSYTPGAE